MFVWNISDSSVGASIDGRPTLWHMPAALTSISILPVAWMMADMVEKSVTLAACTSISSEGYLASRLLFAFSRLDRVRPTMTMREMSACAKVSQKMRPRPPAVACQNRYPHLDRCCVLTPTGNEQCFPRYTKLPTGRGEVRVDSLVVGFGEPRKVRKRVRGWFAHGCG